MFIPSHESIDLAGAGSRHTLLLLHGIFGCGRNWRSFARLLARKRGWRVVLVDLRHHGSSQGATGPNTLKACAMDLRRLNEVLGGAPRTVCGHSFGGKVALLYAHLFPDQLEELWLLDSPPGCPPPAPEQDASHAARVLAALRHVYLPATGRSLVTAELEEQGIPPRVAQWLATNLRRRKDTRFEWCFDLDALGELLEDYRRVDGFPLLENLPRHLDIHVVRAANSEHWPAADRQRLGELAERGVLTRHILPDAGHWLQVDNPHGLLDIMTPGSPDAGPSSS